MVLVVVNLRNLRRLFVQLQICTFIHMLSDRPQQLSGDFISFGTGQPLLNNNNSYNNNRVYAPLSDKCSQSRVKCECPYRAS